MMWNHILSNVGYMFLGLLFLVVTFVKENVILRRKLVRMKVEPTTEGSWPRILELRRQFSETSQQVADQHTGTCASFSLFYTMGLTLFMIGVMSSCYHLCPTDVNFQFDTTYMYLLAIFMAINLFKSRHPDLSPDVTTAFALLAISVLMGVSSGRKANFFPSRMGEVFVHNCLQVLSVYMDVDVQDDYLNIIFFITFVWCCATFAVLFYGVDSVDHDGKVDLKNKENFQWINVSQINHLKNSFQLLVDVLLNPCQQGAGWKVMYLWVPRMSRHILDNRRTKFKSKTRSLFTLPNCSIGLLVKIMLYAHCSPTNWSL